MNVPVQEYGATRILLWIITDHLPYLKKALEVLAKQLCPINLVGVVAAQKVDMTYNSMVLEYIPESELHSVEHDILLVSGGDEVPFVNLMRRLDELQGNTSKMLLDRIPCINGFALEKYRKLQRARLSIFSMNCFGGIISHTLGLPFLTPFINMFFEKEMDFVKFLKAPRVYLEESLEFERTEVNVNLDITYPVYRLGNIFIHMNHYSDFTQAEEKWRERKDKINWYNLCVVMYTDNPEILQQFDALPYGKKVCFVSFPSELDSAFYINKQMYGNRPLANIVNQYASGPCCHYDPFDLLLYGEKTEFMDM